MAELTPQEKQTIAIKKQIAEFLKTAKLRNGNSYTVDKIQQDAQGNPRTLAGTVTTKQGKKETVVEMIWNIQGKALSENIGFDLVKETPIAEYLK